ncbi:BZ3500_MvSof-1268-A1-R1_Chr11-3g03592 [Microbotryum saponariae]|uniref:BZ3500_MvSof-1268-A1-R1_Chr11-3g03592 protein n=1 Tax=Microbotryum saponariae TaxID=289078 RepID=A0A2X0MSV2_9BASI|nr:BZ3500_MvSof-1268-A1-R1_Chr11-3g03592 [Microbotryum saponariae]SDA03601.1 BZ3501_MvSof-1269-A2-R1_Chr11g03169 [Microbotryum saponariae]
MELFNNNNTVPMSNALGMTPACFAIFVKEVRLHTDVVPSKHVTVEEKLAMLLYWLRGSESYRKLDKVFKRSLDTISRYLPETLGLLVHSDLRKQYVVQPTADTPTPSVITDNPRFARYFGDCIGAIDGTLGPWYSTAHDAERWIDRNGDKTQNILAATTFDHRFCYLQSGCEGSAHDQQAWDWARERDLVIPEGKYYLGDAGFATSEECMTPYRNVRYHLEEWLLGSQSPQNPQELFNLRHASLRNAVERIIAVTKRQFAVLVGHPRELPAEHQARIPHACALLHNFIQFNDPINARTGEPRSVSTEEEERQLLREIAAATDLNDSENEYHPDSDHERQRRAHVSTSASKRRMEDLRDNIAERMWADYQTYETEARRLAAHASDEQSIRRAELRELYLLWTREI